MINWLKKLFGKKNEEKYDFATIEFRRNDYDDKDISNLTLTKIYEDDHCQYPPLINSKKKFPERDSRGRFKKKGT